ncbi:MAG TPA: hypothetical protein DEV93_19495 [Chloroflexi bacterium]|nr:hypothetical protein [Chloroflexota bacterium]
MRLQEPEIVLVDPRWHQHRPADSGHVHLGEKLFSRHRLAAVMQRRIQGKRRDVQDRIGDHLARLEIWP